jgi:hypothetical protein
LLFFSLFRVTVHFFVLYHIPLLFVFFVRTSLSLPLHPFSTTCLSPHDANDGRIQVKNSSGNVFLRSRLFCTSSPLCTSPPSYRGYFRLPSLWWPASPHIRPGPVHMVFCPMGLTEACP